MWGFEGTPQSTIILSVFHRMKPKTGLLSVVYELERGSVGTRTGNTEPSLSLCCENCFTVPSQSPNISFHLQLVPEAQLLDAPPAQDLSRISCVWERQDEQISPPGPFPKCMKLSPW